MLTTNELADEVKLTRSRITQYIREGVIQAIKKGRDWLIEESQIEIIKNRPENRGKWNREKKKSMEVQP